METTTNDQRREPLAGETVHQALPAALLDGVVGVFEAPHAANRAFQVLLELGYHPDEVGILIAESTKRRFYLPSLLAHPVELESAASEFRDEMTPADKLELEQESATRGRAMLQGAGAVSAAGALGGILVAATAAVLVPGLGLLMIGPLVGMGAGFGALVGGVYGVPVMENEHARRLKHYESEVQAGKVLIQVAAHNPADETWIRSEWLRIQGATG